MAGKDDITFEASNTSSKFAAVSDSSRYLALGNGTHMYDQFLDDLNGSCKGHQVEYELLRSIWMLGGYPIVALGTVGHVTSLLLLLLADRSIRHKPITVFLVPMSLAGLLALYAGLLPVVVAYHSRHDASVVAMTDVECRVLYAALYFALQLYSWMEVCVAVERLLVVRWPLKCKVWVTRKRNAIAAAAVKCSLLSLAAVPLVVHGTDEAGTCGALDAEAYEAWRYAHSAVYIALPVAIMLPSNGLTLHALRRDS